MTDTLPPLCVRTWKSPSVLLGALRIVLVVERAVQLSCHLPIVYRLAWLGHLGPSCGRDSIILRPPSSQHGPWMGWRLTVPKGRGRGWMFIGVWKVLGGQLAPRPRVVRVQCSLRGG